MKWIAGFFFLMLCIFCTALILNCIICNPQKGLVQAFTQELERFESLVSTKKYGLLIDYDRPIFMKRLWVLDLKTLKQVLCSRVSHARRSGLIYPTDFSNVPNSKKSSYGAFVTRQSYQGDYGLGMRIEGLEKGKNTHARRRAIVFHPAKGRLWSAGCFMTEEAVNKQIIDLTQGGAFLYVHWSDSMPSSLKKTFFLTELPPVKNLYGLGLDKVEPQPVAHGS